jgi:hypothetical protein
MGANKVQLTRKKIEAHETFDNIPAAENGTKSDYTMIGTLVQSMDQDQDYQ